MNNWTARAAPAANTPPPPPVPPPQPSSGRSSPANLPDDAAAAVARVASEFRALERLRDAGYGGAIVREKVNEIRAAVARLPEAVRGRVVEIKVTSNLFPRRS